MEFYASDCNSEDVETRNIKFYVTSSKSTIFIYLIIYILRLH